MNHKKTVNLLFLILILEFLLSSCSLKKSFYQIGSGFNFERFPLIEPYFAIRINDEKIDANQGWTVPLFADQSQRNFLYDLDIHEVRKFAIKNGIIILYSEYLKPIIVNISDGGEEQKKELHWFIIVPNKSEKGYETEEEFNEACKLLDIPQIQWQVPSSISQKFDQAGCLDWIPGCK